MMELTLLQSLQLVLPPLTQVRMMYVVPDS
jgi:hypothetical protein